MVFLCISVHSIRQVSTILWQITCSKIGHNHSPTQSALLQCGLYTLPSRGGMTFSSPKSGLSLVFSQQMGKWCSGASKTRPEEPYGFCLLLTHAHPWEKPTTCWRNKKNMERPNAGALLSAEWSAGRQTASLPAPGSGTTAPAAICLQWHERLMSLNHEAEPS